MIEPLDMAREMAKNLVMGNQAMARVRERLGGGRTTGSFDVPAALEHVRTIFRRYQEGLGTAGLDPSWWHGKHTIEIGPGATLGVQLLQVAAGVAKAHAIDRFPDVQHTRPAAQLYESLLTDLADAQRALCQNEYRTSAGLPVFAFDKIQYDGDCPLETAGQRLKREYDVALLHFALEHVANLRAGISALARILKPGGLLYVMLYTERLDAELSLRIAAFMASDKIPREQAFGWCSDGRGCPYARAYTEAEGRALLEAAGFRVTRAFLFNSGYFRTFRGERP